MRLLHRRLCASAYWRRMVGSEIVPWVLDGRDLGTRVLEVGPGPGAATDVLRSRVGRLTCVEVDLSLAHTLSERMAGHDVVVLCADATRLPLADRSFDAAVSLTMLHHVPSPALQDRLLLEVARVLRPGGIFAGFDARAGALFRLLHAFETMVPIDPDTFPARLELAGFKDVEIDVRSRGFAFRAVRVRNPDHVDDGRHQACARSAYSATGPAAASTAARPRAGHGAPHVPSYL